MFVTRLLSGIVLVLIALVTGIMGGPVFCLTVMLISWIGLFELYRVFHIEKTLLAAAGYLSVIINYLLLYLGKGDLCMALTVVFFLLLMAIYVFSFPKITSEEVMGAFFGFFYAGILMSYLYQTRVMADGQYMMWLIFLSSWGCDTCAYCVGMLFGKHKMAPKLSPKKSIEGGIGGIVGAAFLGAAYAWFFKDSMLELKNPVLQCAILCGVSGMISQVGDLAASAIKRNHDIKDYGTLIPGHGGIMDRFDSILFTAPIIYYLAYWMVRYMN